MQKVRRKHLELDEELVSWFEEHYPEASMPWMVNMLLREFKIAHTVTPLDYARQAALSVKDKLEDGVIGNG